LIAVEDQFTGKAAKTAFWGYDGHHILNDQVR
jgi:hypothetical protein